MTALAFTTKEINRNFKIKVAGYNNDTKKLNTLVGVSGLVNLIELLGAARKEQRYAY